MYLKSIEMQGFKSFPDRTRLLFDHGGNLVDADNGYGVTVIVGPNGSGKSNIADAMRWVLGEISSKSLRGSKMEDVIFGGADSRRPMGYAEVSITFDNTVGKGHLDCPYDEVTVTRRYFRAGESEYLINRKAVRLRDIYELFLNTGIGRDGYSIIGQGRIAEIISQKSDERRGAFEDASGIAKYRVKKNEAERKLNATEDNMTRIRDVFAEVEAQVGPLSKEAEKAKKALVLLESRKRADIGLWLYDTEALRDEIATTESLRSHAAFDMEQAEDALQTLDVQNKRLLEISQSSKQTSEELLKQIGELTERNHALESEFRLAENNRMHLNELITSTTENRSALELQMSRDREEIVGREATLADLDKKLGDLNQTYADHEAQEAATRVSIEELETAVATCGEDIHRLEQESVDLRVRVSVLENARDSGSDRNTDLLTDMEAYEATSKELQTKCAAHQKTVDDYAARLVELEKEIETIDKTRDALNSRYSEEYERLNQEKLRRDTVSQRIATYKAMEEHFEGYASSVRYVMKQYAEGNITDFHGRACGTIYGPLSKVIRVADAYVTAIETALGPNLQHIVVEDEATAKAAMYCLKRAQAGRATFFPLTSMRPQTETNETKQAADYQGFIAMADALVDSDSRFGDVISSLLGRTVVFDTIDNATAMAKDLKYRVRVVTLDGQQINVGGSFTGGSVNQKSGVLSRAGELKRLDEELAEIEAKLPSLEENLHDCKDCIRQADEDCADLEDKQTIIRELMQQENGRLEQMLAKKEANDTLLQHMKEDFEQILKMSEQYEEDMAALKQEEAAKARQIEELRSLRRDKLSEQENAEDRLDDLSKAKTELIIRINQVQKDIETEQTLLRVCEERMTMKENDLRAADERIQSHRQTILDYEVSQAENRKQATAGEEQLAELNRRRAETEGNRAEYEAKLAALTEKIRAKMADKEVIFRELTTVESKLTLLKEKMDKLSGKLWDDYEMTRADALEADHTEVTKENHAEVERIQTECRNKIRAIGHFDPDAVEKYAEVRERYEYMGAQINDLEKSRTELVGIISGLEKEMCTAFVDAFNRINDNFNQTFVELFGGGSAELSLTDPENVLESGIEIKAAPPGKIIKNLMQLSGGEQAFIGVALFFAILKVNPTPFCFLDEIEAALDEVNVERLAQYIKRYSSGTQFIMITHRRGTMAAATRLYGVTMPEHGISKVLALDVSDISKNKESDWDGIFNEPVWEKE